MLPLKSIGTERVDCYQNPQVEMLTSETVTSGWTDPAPPAMAIFRISQS